MSRTRSRPAPRSRSHHLAAVVLVAAVALAAGCADEDPGVDPAAEAETEEGLPDEAVAAAEESDDVSTSDTEDADAATDLAPRPTGLVEDVPERGPQVELGTPDLPTTVTDATGEDIEIASIERIVSLQGDISEFLTSLSVIDRVVGHDQQSVGVPDLPEDSAMLGSSFDLNAEAVLELAPDLVLVKQSAGPDAAIAGIRDAGIPVVTLADGNDLEVAVDNARLAGAALGASASGDELAALIAADIDQARELAALNNDPPSVAFVGMGQGGPSLLGPPGPAHALIVAAGGDDVALDLGIEEANAPLTPEALLQAAPEIILTSTINVAAAGSFEEFLQIPGIGDTPAAQNGHVYVYDVQFVLPRSARTGAAALEFAELFLTVGQD